MLDYWDSEFGKAIALVRGIMTVSHLSVSDESGGATTPERTVSWGHWRIWFCLAHDEDRKDFWSVSFPVGAQGPCDGYLGSKEREHWKNVCRAWTERAELPVGAKLDPALLGHSFWNGERHTPCNCGERYHVDCKRRLDAAGRKRDPR